MTRTHRSTPSRHVRRSGFGLVDICVALVVLSISLGILVSSVFSGIRMAKSDQETAAANQALRSAMTRLEAAPAREVFAVCNLDASDDLQGQSASSYLAIPTYALTDREGGALSITASFPVLDQAPGVLREDLDLPELGLPRDLNGDGTIDSGDHADDFVLLPILLTLEWDGPSGAHSVRMATILTP